MNLSWVIRRLQGFAPLHLTSPGGWDNTGLLLEPSGSCSLAIRKVFLTIDLTERTLEEALRVQKKGEEGEPAAGGGVMIISYHPPIFRPRLSRLVCEEGGGDAVAGVKGEEQKPEVVKTRILIKAIENRIPVYSPHTSWDCVQGGITDWLAKGLCCVPGGASGRKVDTNGCLITPISPHPKDPSGVHGEGRQIRLQPGEQISLRELISRVKTHLKLEHVRVALPAFRLTDLPLHPLSDQLNTNSDKKKDVIFSHEDRQRCLDAPFISGVAVCAGSGGSVLDKCRGPSLPSSLSEEEEGAAVPIQAWVTGEMSHHEVLAATSRGFAVLLCEHSNTERGFLKDLAACIFPEQVFNVPEEGGNDASSPLEFIVSTTDEDPLTVM